MNFSTLIRGLSMKCLSYPLLTCGMKPGLEVVTFRCPSSGWSGLTGDELGAVVKMPGGEKVPLMDSPPGTGTLTPPTRIEYSVLGSKPFTRNWVSDPV